MRIETEGKMKVAYPKGRIDIATANEFKENISKLIDGGENNICLDFSDVSGLDSSGLGKLLLFQKRLKENGGKLSIRNVNSEYVKKIFTLVHLNRVIDIR